MKNVLVSIVGDRDPLDYERFSPEGADSFASDLRLDPGPILETIYMFETDSSHAEVPLHKVWLLYTDDKSNKKIKDRVEWLCSFLEGRNIEAAPYDLKVNNPSDYSLLIPSMSIASSYIKRTDEGAKFFILTSPGTPQMSATWIVLGNEGRLPGTFLQKVPGKRVYEGIPGRSKVISRNDNGLLLPIPLSPFFEHEKVEQVAFLLEEQMAFASCAVLLAGISRASLFESRKPLYDSCGVFCILINYWENNNYVEALELGKQMEAQLRRLLAVFNGDLYNQVIQSLTLLSQPNHSEKSMHENVKNLLARARRAEAMGDPTSSVTWAFLAYETALAGILRNPPYNFSDFDKGTIEQKEQRLLGTGFSFKYNDKTINCEGATPAYAGMKRVKNDKPLYTLVNELRKMRNEIIHKNATVTSKNAKKLVNSAVKVIAIFLDSSSEELEVFPYSAVLGKDVAGVVRRIVRAF